MISNGDDKANEDNGDVFQGQFGSLGARWTFLGRSQQTTAAATSTGSVPGRLILQWRWLSNCQIVKQYQYRICPRSLHFFNHFSSSFLLLLAISTLLSWRWPLLTVDCVLIAQCYSDRCHHRRCFLILQWRWLSNCQIVKQYQYRICPRSLHFFNHFSSSFLLLLAISTLLSWRWPLLTVDCVLIAQCYSDRCHHCHCLILQWRWLSNCQIVKLWSSSSALTEDCFQKTPLPFTGFQVSYNHQHDDDHHHHNHHHGHHLDHHHDHHHDNRHDDPQPKYEWV